MIKKEAKEMIFTLLCVEYQRPGSDGWVSRDRLFKELAIQEKVFNAALMELRGNSDLNIELAASGKIRLGLSGRQLCDDTKAELRKKSSDSNRI
jgi:hypothetical protein